MIFAEMEYEKPTLAAYRYFGETVQGMSGDIEQETCFDPGELE